MPEHRRRVPWLRIALVVAVLVGGAVGTVVTWRQEVDRAEQEAAATADRAQALLVAIGVTLDVSLSGAAAIVDRDGTIDADAFAAFAAELTGPGGFTALAYEEVVPASERPAFEARIGAPMIDRPPDGPVPAARRDEHYAVASVLPPSERSVQLVGFDLLGDPVRAAAAQQARDVGTTVFSEPVPSEPSRTNSIFVIKPVYRIGVALDDVDDRRANLVGFVSTTLLTEDLGTAIAFVLPEGADFELRDGDALLASSDDGDDGDGTSELDGGVVRTAAAANRQWTLRVAATEHGLAVPVLAGVLTLLVGGALVYELISSDRRGQRARRAARRTEHLALLAEGLAGRTSTEEVMTYLTTHVLAPLGASHAAVAVIEGDRLRRYYTPGERTTAARRLLPDAVALDADMPLAQAARTGQEVLVPDVEVVRSRYPRLVDAWQELGFGATANLPLRDRHGQLLGALGLAWDRPVDFADLRNLLDTVAGIAGQTIDRARLSDAEHGLITALQEGLLTPLPAVAGLDVAERYLPAAEDVGMGGDWYEGIPLDGDRYLVVVGDIAGHGIAAVTSMAKLRSAIGAMAALGTPVEEILPLASALAQSGELVVATAAVIEIDQRAGRLRYACAGHPPPIVRLPDGTVEVLEGGRLPLLGVPMDRRPVGEHPFPIGSALICFTDGLIERPGEGIDVSIARLADELAVADAQAADALATELLAHCLADVPRDDVALAVVVRTG